MTIQALFPKDGSTRGGIRADPRPARDAAAGSINHAAQHHGSDQQGQHSAGDKIPVTLIIPGMVGRFRRWPAVI